MRDDYTDAEGWTYTTPIFAGTTAAVQKAATCKHEYSDQPLSRTIINENEMVMQGCKHCCSMRAKRRPLVKPNDMVKPNEDKGPVG